MKIRRLNEIDLARFCAITDDDSLRQELRRYNLGGGAWSYDPVRRSIADILNAQIPLFTPIAEPSAEQLQSQITRACNRGAVQAEANWLVGKTLLDYRTKYGWRTVKFLMGSMPLGFGESASYWSDVVIDDGGSLIIAYFDQRREGGIQNAQQRRIVHSMQNAWVRDRHLDLSSAKLAVIRFPSQPEGRAVDIQYHDETNLLQYEDLDAAVKRVYRLWAEVSREKQAKERASGTGGKTPMGF